MEPKRYILTIEEKSNEIQMDAIDMQRDLEKQLHEQYAVNTNTNLGTVLSLVGALLASFGFYGMVFVDCGIYQKYDYSDLTFVTIACLCVLTLIAVVCMQMGSSLRSDQFVIYKIRRKYYATEEKYNDVFTSGYKPTNKGYFDFLPGLFGVIAHACFGGYVLVVTMSEINIRPIPTCYLELILLAFAFNVCIYAGMYNHFYDKYKERANSIKE